MKYTCENQHTHLRFILEWQRPIHMASHWNYNLNTNEDFVMFLDSQVQSHALSMISFQEWNHNQLFIY